MGAKGSMVRVHETHLQEVWSRFDSQLQDALYGVHVQHKMISTRKALAALQSINNNVQRTFSRMVETEIPLKGQDSDSVRWSSEHTSFFDEVQTSPCVENTCRRLAKMTEGVIDSEKFFLYLVDTSCGPTVTQWREDGYTSERIKALYYAE